MHLLFFFLKNDLASPFSDFSLYLSFIWSFKLLFELFFIFLWVVLYYLWSWIKQIKQIKPDVENIGHVAPVLLGIIFGIKEPALKINTINIKL